MTLGIAFDVAALVGVPLFHEDRTSLGAELLRRREHLTLLPQRVREPEEDLGNDF